MLRLALSAVTLACVLAMAQPVFADPLAATAASDHAHAAAAVMEQPSSLAPAWSSDAPADVLVEPVGNAVPLGRVGMSFIVAGGVLLLALLVGIVLDGIGVRRQQKARRDIPRFDAW